MKRNVILLFIAVFALKAMAQEPSLANRKIDSVVKKSMQDGHVPGMALAVIRNGVPEYVKYYGLANVETQTPVTKESVFMLASLSKQFIATAVLLLQQQGKLALDTPAIRYVPELPVAWKDITIRQLLSHTSGMVRDPPDYQPYIDQPIMNVLKSMYHVPLNSRPGEGWLYSNAGYFLLAEIISRVSGQPWDIFIEEHIFKPAGMTHTVTNSSKDIIPNRVSGYHQEANHMINAENWIAVRPSGAFSSTLGDMIRWDKFLDTSHLLNEQNRKLMWTPGSLTGNKPTVYGFGWYIESFLGRPRIHHDGQYPGFRSDWERFTDDSLHLILFANGDNKSLEGLALRIAGLYEPSLNPPPFVVSLQKSEITTAVNKSVSVNIDVRTVGKAAPGCVVEMEIWDEKGRSVYKDNAQNQDFRAGETEQYHFPWTPDRSGVYTINVGVYGPHWVLGYAWRMNLGKVIVR